MTRNEALAVLVRSLAGWPTTIHAPSVHEWKWVTSTLGNISLNHPNGDIIGENEWLAARATQPVSPDLPTISDIVKMVIDSGLDCNITVLGGVCEVSVTKYVDQL